MGFEIISLHLSLASKGDVFLSVASIILMADGRVKKTTNAFGCMRAGFSCLKSYVYYDYTMVWDGALIFGLNY